MGQYYYFVASLPYLAYDDAQSTPPDEFLKAAGQHLTPSDLQILESASIDAPISKMSGNPTLGAWQRFERGLRNTLVRLRTKGGDPESYVRTDEAGRDETDRPGLDEMTRDALAEESPLSGERSLGRARWSFLDDLASGHFFDLSLLIVHYLKLQLLARNRLFNRAEGERVFTEATESIMNEHYQERSGV